MMDFQGFKNRYQKVEVEHYPTAVNERPMVSVCVQTYQHVNFIRQCLDGILMQQTDFDFEILLGEDASTDGTREICRAYADGYPEKIRLFLHDRGNNIRIHDKHTGRFNFAYNLFSAKGRYIALCEGDDYWTDPMKLQKQVDFLEGKPNFSMCGHWSHKLVDSKIAGLLLGKFNKSEFTYNDLAGSNVRIPTSSIVFRNHLILPNWFCMVYGGDLAIIFLNAQQGNIRVLDFAGSVYRVHGGGLEQAYKENKAALPERNISEYLHYRTLISGRPKRKLDKKLSWNYFYLSLVRLKEFNIATSLALLVRAFIYKIKSFA